MIKRIITVLTAVAMCATTMVSTAFAAEIPNASVENTSVATENTSVTTDDGWMPLGMPTEWNDDVVLAGDDSTNGVETLAIGGTETWEEGMDWANQFTFYGNNLTPVKTMGVTGTLYLTVVYNSSTPVKLQFQVRKANSSTTLASWTTGANTYYENNFPGISVTKGQKIQLYFRVLDKNGNYDTNRPLKISYGYALWS